MELNNRCFKILRTLFEKDDYVSVKTLSKELGYSERIIRYNVEKIEEYLRNKKYSFLYRDYKKGLIIIKNKQSENFYREYLNIAPPYEYKYSAKERCSFIIGYLLKRNGYTPIEKLANELLASVSTITKDLENVEKWLGDKNTLLIKKAGKGITIQIDEIKRRALYRELTDEILTPSSVINYINNISLDERTNTLLLDDLFKDLSSGYLIEQIQYLEKELGEIFSDETFSSLLIHLAMIVYRVKNNSALKEITGETTLNNSIEYTLTSQMAENIKNHFDIAIPNEEIYYFTVHLLGAKVITKKTKFKFNELETIEIRNIAVKMVEEISKLYAVDFNEKKDDVIDGLITHLIPTVYRIKYKKRISNPIYPEMEQKYSDLLENTKIVCRHLSEYCKEEINEQEVSYIAMHFLAALHNKLNKKTNIPKAIVVCGSGYGTAQVVAMQLSSLFNVEIKAIVSQREIINLDKSSKNFDYIISTVNIANLKKDDYIKISPMFNHNDFLEINKYLRAKFIKSKIDYSQLELAGTLANISMKYNPKVNKLQLQYEILLELINQNKNNTPEYTNESEINLKDLITPSFIRLNVICTTWQEAIIKGTEILEEKNFITDAYKVAIIKNIEEMGPQMVIVPGIVLAHLAPGKFCKKLGFSITTLKKPVIFGFPRHDPVKVVITLSLVNEHIYKKALMQLFNILQNRNTRNVLINASSKNEILDLIKQYSS
ncbi:BglG family transcription antiterminator [Anaerofustis stercorihominis]|uniref:BglG family transcription antiterminator n=1 Tax=Anaerofustis stercorihominis TaxID=214853 RepID=UPI00214B371B|nr:BglG family transcription antiterminator [Anaerofustis stercorihominis]MCR2032027.1 BglG family transcription antiterminator [Anaerofustis stercorihominis]